jgi:hypothetical protein
MLNVGRSSRRLLQVFSLLLVCAPLAAQEKVVDRSNGSFAGWVWYIKSRDGAPAEQAYAAIAIARLPDSRLEQAFGLWAAEGKQQLGALTGDTVQTLINSEREVLAVRVGPRAFDEVRHMIYMWGRKDHGETPPGSVAEMLFQRAANTIGLKAPPRPAFEPPDAIAYLRDLSKINR